jgi:hypothetical protein
MSEHPWKIDASRGKREVAPLTLMPIEAAEKIAEVRLPKQNDGQK